MRRQRREKKRATRLVALLGSAAVFSRCFAAAPVEPRPTLRVGLGLVCALGLTFAPLVARAQTATDVPAGEPAVGLSRTGETEGADTTRLDVERLPAEAITITRELYAHGFFVEGSLGARVRARVHADLAARGIEVDDEA